MTDRPQRIQLRRTKGWRLPEGAVKVDRTTPWGNPSVILGPGGDGSYVVLDDPKEPYGLVRGTFATRRDAAEAAAHVFRKKLFADGPLREQAAWYLRGKNLACWCPLDQPCHADVLLELANRPLRCEAV